MKNDELSELRRLIAENLDLDTTYIRFQRETGKEDKDDFLTYLHERRLIDDDTLCFAHSREQIDLNQASSVLRKRDDRYRILDMIGQGGMAEIRVAKDSSLRRKVAVKCLKPELMHRAVIQRFVKEAQVTAQLDHPNIVPVYSLENRLGESGEMLCFAMKLIHGVTLEQLISETRRALQQSPRKPLDDDHSLMTRLEHFLKICDAMSYAHSKAVVHRDLKPSNIMIGKFGEVYVMDWGLAHLLYSETENYEALLEMAESDADLYIERTHIGDIIGTPRYMSPEQAAGMNDELDQRSDLYALGMILFELVTLKHAIKGNDPTTILMRAAKRELEPLEPLFPHIKIAPELKAIILKATALKRDDRYQSADELAEDVRRFMLGEEVSALPDTRFRMFLRWMALHERLTLWMVLGIIFVSMTATIWALQRRAAAVQAARVREDRLTHVLSEVAVCAHMIDNDFLRYEGILTHLSDTSVNLLMYGHPSNDPLTPCTDFEKPGAGPPDLAKSSVYGMEISIGYPVYKLAPGVTPATVMPALKRLAPLRYVFKRVFLESSGMPMPATDAAARERLMEKGVPVRWAYIGLSDGVMFSYPGKAGYPPEYDPRLRPWYRLGVQGRTIRWGNPYPDLLGQGLVLPCVKPLYDLNGKFHGVAGIEITFDYIIQKYLKPTEHRATLESFLVDDQGHIVIRSSQLWKEFEPGKLHDALALETFPDTRVVEDIRKGGSGLVQAHDANRQRIIVYTRIPTLGWYYIEKRDLASVLKR